MECCRICLASYNLISIFESIDIAPNIQAIACVDISQDDGLPQYICLLCKHELDISINFKDKCENTFEMLKEQHAKEIEVKENIILNLLSGGNVMDEKLPKGARESVLKTVWNSVRTDNRADNSNDEELEEYGMDDQVTRMTDMDDQMTDTTENDFEFPIELMKNDELTCIKCNFYFVNKKCLLDHLKRIHPKTMCQCQICLLHFATTEILREHLRSSHDVSDPECLSIRCKICRKTFELQSDLNAHLCSLSQINNFCCTLCKKNFKFEAELESHVENLHQKSNFTCDECEKTFKEYNHYKSHMDGHIILDTNVNQIELFCSECKRSFSSNTEWTKHIVSCANNNHEDASLEKNSVCPLCHKNCETHTELQLHTHEKTHNSMDIVESFSNKTLSAQVTRNTKSHVCSICKMSFFKKNSLESHLLLHNNLIKCRKAQTLIDCVLIDK